MKFDIIEVDFRVCCNHSKNKALACLDTMKAINKKFYNITSLHPVRPCGEADDVCVIGTAIVSTSKKEKFRRDLKNLKIPGRKIESVKVMS